MLVIKIEMQMASMIEGMAASASWYGSTAWGVVVWLRCGRCVAQCGWSGAAQGVRVEVQLGLWVQVRSQRACTHRQRFLKVLLFFLLLGWAAEGLGPGPAEGVVPEVPLSRELCIVRPAVV